MANEKKTQQFLLTPAAGKRIIAKSLLFYPSLLEALHNRTVVIVAGTTNGYVAEEILDKINQGAGFSKKSFFRGITLPPKYSTTDTEKLGGDNTFPGDVVIVRGKWEKGKTIFDVADNLQQGDIVIKGANAINLETMQAAILIGHPKAGTISAALQAVMGRRVELYLPVGLEKRISGDINRIAVQLNSPNASGPRYYPVCGNVVTEIQALKIMTGVDSEVVAAGGVGGAEGSSWLAVSGTDEQLNEAKQIIYSACEEPAFEL